jgi:capsid assembly protease
MARSRNLLRVWSAIMEYPWAISPEGQMLIESILDRAMAGTDVDLAAVATQIGRPLDNTGGRVEMRGNTAVFDIQGPIFRRSDLFTSISSSTTVENLAVDLKKATDDRLVSGILLNIDSPGGQVNGIQEFADQVREAGAIKPVVAYIDGNGASGAYWIASAANSIVVNDSSMVGSIGVVANIRDNRAAQERQGVKNHEIVSTQSPFKRPDVATPEGRAQIQEIVDSLASVFIDRVASFRGISADEVMKSYGQGRMLPAKQAMQAGMADEVSRFEPLVARLAVDAGSPRAFITVKENPMATSPTNTLNTGSTTNQTPPAAAAPQATTNPAPAASVTYSAVSSGTPVPAAVVTLIPPPINERQRISAILTCPEAAGREGLAQALALETEESVEVARKVLAAAPKATAATPAPAPNALAAEMAKLKNPEVGAGGGGANDDSPAAEASRVLAFANPARRLPHAS